MHSSSAKVSAGYYPSPVVGGVSEGRGSKGGAYYREGGRWDLLVFFMMLQFNNLNDVKIIETNR